MQAYNSLSFSREIVVVFRRRGPKKRSRRDRLALLANLSSRLLFRWREFSHSLGRRRSILYRAEIGHRWVMGWTPPDGIYVPK